MSEVEKAQHALAEAIIAETLTILGDLGQLKVEELQTIRRQSFSETVETSRTLLLNLGGKRRMLLQIRDEETGEV